MAINTKQDLQKLLDQVTSQLSVVLEKAEKPIEGEALNKATPGNEAPAEKNPAGSSTEGSEESSSPAGDTDGDDKGSAPAASPPAEGSAPPAGGPPADASASASPAGAGAAPQDPALDSGGSVESLQAEYAALPIEELKMHMLACKAALISQMAQGGVEDQSAAPGAPGAGLSPDAGMPPAGGPPADASAAPSPDASASPAPTPPPAESTPPMTKSQDLELLERISNLEKSIKEKDELLNGFGTALTKFNEKLSTRKAVTRVSELNKPGTELAKSEDKLDISTLSLDSIKSQLNQLTATTKLNKSDKDAVMSFVVGSNTDVTKIAHLLKKN
jgi:hypothetical protein